MNVIGGNAKTMKSILILSISLVRAGEDVTLKSPCIALNLDIIKGSVIL